MRCAILSGGDGWHVRDLQRAAAEQGHDSTIVDFRRVSAGVGIAHDPFDGCDAVIVRTMPPGSLEQVVFRMDVLHRLQAEGKRVLNPPLALEACVDKYLASARLEAAGAVIMAPKLFGPSDPGCKAYTATALPAYNKTISDLNAQASQATLTNDMSAAIVDLQTAGAQAQSDDELLNYARRNGSTCYHASCTCMMGSHAMAVVDDEL